MATSTLRFISLKEVPRFLPVSYQRAAGLAREGILPVVRLGRRVFVERQQLEKFVSNGGQALRGGWRRESK